MNRRDLLTALVSTTAAAAAIPGAALAGYASDPAIEAVRKFLELETRAINLQSAADDIAAALPRETLHDPAPCEAPAHIRKHFDRFFGEKPVTLQQVINGNRAHESVCALIDMGARDLETEAEYQRRRAIGRAKVRWWISEKRKRVAAVAASGLPEAEAQAEAAWEATRAARDACIAAPAVTPQSVLAKLQLAAERLDLPEDGSELEHEGVNDRWVWSVFRDARALAMSLS